MSPNPTAPTDNDGPPWGKQFAVAEPCAQCGDTVPDPTVDTPKGKMHKSCWREWVTKQVQEE